MNFSIAVVGKKEEILGFRAVGAEIFPVENEIDALEILRKIKKMHGAETKINDLEDLKKLPTTEELARENDSKEKLDEKKFAVVFVLENIFEKIPAEEIKKLSTGALPAIIPIPGARGSTGAGIARVNRLVEKAVGSDIFAN